MYVYVHLHVCISVNTWVHPPPVCVSIFSSLTGRSWRCINWYIYINMHIYIYVHLHVCRSVYTWVHPPPSVCVYFQLFNRTKLALHQLVNGLREREEQVCI